MDAIDVAELPADQPFRGIDDVDLRLARVVGRNGADPPGVPDEGDTRRD
jgi:hypothetical protein